MTDVLAKDYSPEVLMEMVEGFERWKNKTGHREFLLSVIKGRVPGGARILDAALGAGYDAISIIQNGYRVTGNDIDVEALATARKNARKAGINQALLPVTLCNWLDMDEHHNFTSPFDAVLCVGNSLTYLFEREEQRKALGNLALNTALGGVLIVDERNYQYMLDHAGEIRNGTFEYPGIYALSKEDVHLTPNFITHGEVGMRARSRETGHTLDLKFYPFKRNELLGLLRETGFIKIEQFSDYVPGFNKNADFYQYVCTK